MAGQKVVLLAKKQNNSDQKAAFSKLLQTEYNAISVQSINELKGKITIFVVAHRLSSVLNSDRLIVLEKGKIIETGSPKELLEDKKSYFYKVYNIRE